MKKNITIIFCMIITIGLFSENGLSNKPVLHKIPDSINYEEMRSITRDPPEGDEIVSPAEFNRANGVLIAWPGWGQGILTDIAYEVARDYNVYIMVSDLEIAELVSDYLVSMNVNMENVYFILDSNISSTSMWIRDYGPFYIYEDGDQALVDFFYGTYVGDDDIPYTIAESFDIPIYDSDILHHGGNFITDGNRMAFCSTNIYNYNPGSTETEIKNVFRDYLGIDSLIVIEPMHGDGTGHIDMFCKLLNDTLFIVGEYENPAAGFPGDFELLNDLAEYLETLQNIDGRNFAVARIPMPPFTYGGPAGTINYTYTNSLIINDKVLVPVYGFESDEIALQIYQESMPNHEIIGLDSSFIIEWWGAIHCITKLHYSTNPLIILHEQLENLEGNSTPGILFRVNPLFENTEASVFYKLESEDLYTEVTAYLADGIWTATLSLINENFSYYISTTSISGENEFNTTLPEDAPLEVFEVEVNIVSCENNVIKPIFEISNFPNPFNPTTTISYDLPDNIANPVIEIFNIKGEKVREFPIVSPSPSHQVSVTW
ncbi:MAG: agmatine deiminase family protein, partial [Candidatus Cloacimonetes bacterium]|nr:agmatine deiminase family protein [Candidatus Cloacimonadota bacterium]